MRFALDVDGRFVVVAKDNGWDLLVDDQMVHYCRELVDALAYMSEELRQESDADGVPEAVMALRRIEETMARAADIVVMHKTAVVVARVLRHDDLKDASLELGQCQTLSEFKALPNRRQIVAQARAILEAHEGVTNARL